MASIYKRGKSWWIAYYIAGRADPVRRSLKTTNRRVAEREKQAVEARLIENFRRVPEDRNPKFDDFWPQYVAWAQSGHLRPRTLERKKDFWTQFRDSQTCERMGDVTIADVEAFKRSRRAEGNAPATINKALTDLQAIYARAAKLGLYTGPNPFKVTDRFRETKKVPLYHSESDLIKLLDAAEKKSQHVMWTVLLCGWAGLRRNELVNCRFDWFDFANRKIKVKSFPGFSIKDHEEREIDMSVRIMDEFQMLALKEGFVFNISRPSAGKSRYRFDPKRALVSLLKEVGLPTDKPFQRLRVTYGSILVAKGVPLKKVSRMMGHASVTTTEKHYVGIEPFDRRIDF